MVPASQASQHPAIRHGAEEDDERRDVGQVVEGQEGQAGRPATGCIEDRHDVQVDGPRARDRADAHQDTGAEHPAQAATLDRAMHPAVGPGGRHHRRAPAGQEHVLEHPERHEQGEDRRDARHQVVLTQPAKEAEQAKPDQEIGNPDRADVQGPGAQESPPRFHGRRAVRGHAVDQGQGVGREQHQQGEGARVQAVREP